MSKRKEQNLLLYLTDILEIYRSHLRIHSKYFGRTISNEQGKAGCSDQTYRDYW